MPNANETAMQLVLRMSLDEKIHMVHGHVASRYEVPPLEHLGIPALKMTDGPSGVNAGGDSSEPSTAFPSALALAATFSPELAHAQGAAIAAELLLHGMNVLLAPNLDIVRHPWWGRATEQFGEDPHLVGRMGAAFVQGVQSNGVAACAKHFVAYGQETGRMHANDIQVDDRTLREVFLAPFERVVKEGGVDTVMSSFNRINGVESAEHSLIAEVLKGEWGFSGWIMSDYGSLSRAVPAALAGFDQEMPGVPSEAGGGMDETYPGSNGPEALFGVILKRAVQDGRVPLSRLDDMVFRILHTMLARGMMDEEAVQPVDREMHRHIARSVAEASLTLLKNDGVLPLERPASLVLVGADAGHRTASGGASVVAHTTAEITPLSGIADACAERGIAFRWLPGSDKVGPAHMLAGPPPVPSSVLTTPSGGPGLEARYWSAHSPSGEPLAVRDEAQIALDVGFLSQLMNASDLPPPPGQFGAPLSANWRGAMKAPLAGEYRLALTCMGSAKLFVGGQFAVAVEGSSKPFTTWADPMWLEAGEVVDIEVQYSVTAHENWLELGDVVLGWQPPTGFVSPAAAEAALAASSADIAVVFAHPYESEQRDRANLVLPNAQDELISAICAANPRTVVVLSSGGPVLMPWLDKVAAVIQIYHPGQEGGAALAAALFGEINPSGRVPITWPRHEADVPVPHPWLNGSAATLVGEGPAVGHRLYEATGTPTLFPFGHGLSYTRFGYHALSVEDRGENGLVALVQISNEGTRPGTEVVQVYQKASSRRGTWHRLVGFARVTLDPGQMSDVPIHIRTSDLSFWDEKSRSMRLPEGVELAIGRSAGELMLRTANIGPTAPFEAKDRTNEAINATV